VGKYDKIIEFTDNARAIAVSNIRIANELAEANRLKRIEIDIMMTNMVDPGQLANIKTKDYQEDKA